LSEQLVHQKVPPSSIGVSKSITSEQELNKKEIWCIYTLFCTRLHEWINSNKWI